MYAPVVAPATAFRRRDLLVRLREVIDPIERAGASDGVPVNAT
jgi:hypothetical protein